MAQPPVFVDTVALLALANRDDALHARARKVHEDLTLSRRTLITSDLVLTEFLGAAVRQPLREAACRMIQRLRDSVRTRIVPADRQRWDEAYELYAARPDKQWSLVDCDSILLCQQESIRQVFTQDRHFIQAGLEVLLA